MIVRVEEEVGWRRLQDELLSFKLRHMEGLQALSGLMSHHGRGSKPCPFCEEDSLADSVLNHVLARYGAEMGLVEACDGDWVMEHLHINFLAKFCTLLSPCITGVLYQVYNFVLLVGFSSSNEPLNLEPGRRAGLVTIRGGSASLRGFVFVRYLFFFFFLYSHTCTAHDTMEQKKKKGKLVV